MLHFARTKMGNSRTLDSENTAHLCSNIRIAPSGRVIRSSGRRIIPVAAPANSDQSQSYQVPHHKLRLIALVTVGISCGALLSLIAMPFDYLLSDRLSRTMYNAVTSRLSHSEFDSERNQSRSLRQARVEHEIKKVTAQRDKLLEGLLVAAPAGPSAAQSMRLASYHTGTSAEIESSKPPSISPTRDPMDKLPNHSLRAVVGRVHSVIRKYAPKQQNPSQLAQAIVQESARQGVDPLFVAAVVKTESTFNSSARSHKGAQGLMQIMPATGAWLSQKHDLPRGKLTDPDHNLRLGISYLKHLERTYHGNRVFALVAYNWGPGHVDSAAGGKRKIPKQCMQYALRIMQDYKRWSSGVI